GEFLAASDGPATDDEATRQDLQAFLNSVRDGRCTHEPSGKDAKFFVLGLMPNASRLAVNLFFQSDVQTLVEKLHEHHSHLRIEPWDRFPEFPPIWMLLKETVRRGDSVSPVLEGPLLRAILTGGLYPRAWFQAVLRRLHAERAVTLLKCAAIRAYLTRNRKMEVPMSLSLESTSAAYRIGRLFAALEKTQDDALGNVNSGIRDRFYSSASATPGVVMPRLMRTYQHHLAKLVGGRKTNREKLVQEILSPLDPLEGFPERLTLEDQGLFALGYYHQRQDFFTKRSPDSEGNPE
ncbi:MAG: type I-C CRISPR-associated protein Cas8c/Csd1, partial [Myxococcota bacterium]